MRCLSCNANLSDFESTRRVASTGEFLDLCNHCYHPIEEEVPCIERGDLTGDDNFIEEIE